MVPVRDDMTLLCWRANPGRCECMPLDPAQLPDDIAELKRLLVAGDAELTARMAELAAAKNGLVITQLTIEKLKAQIARLRREKFGASSERIERTLAQLELALEEAETAKAEAIALAPPSSEPEVASPEAPPAEAAQREKKKRRTLPRRDVVHAPAGVCKTCGGSELRQVGSSVTEVLFYVPARFEVIRPRAPGLLVQEVRDDGAGADAGPPHSTRHGRRELPRPHRHSQVLRPHFRSTGRPRSTRAAVSTSTAASSPNGSAMSPGCCGRSSISLPRM